MHVIIPIAGPDFLRHDGSIKGLVSYQGHPLLKYALDSRPWALDVNTYTFVLYDCMETRQFANDYLKTWYPHCSIVYITSFTRGAAISSLAAISQLKDFCDIVIIDLADIIYRANIDIRNIFNDNSNIGGVGLVFESNATQYSYLKVNRDMQLIEAAEKKVISNFASTGTYIFRDSTIILKSIAHAIKNETSQTYNDLFYVCPLFNGVVAEGKNVVVNQVYDVKDIKNISLNH